MHAVPITTVILCAVSVGIGYLACYLNMNDREVEEFEQPTHVHVLDDHDLAEAIQRQCPELFDRPSDPFDWQSDAGMNL